MLLNSKQTFIWGDLLCEWDDLPPGGIDSRVLSWVCFAHINGHPDKFNTLLSLTSTCSNSAYSSKISLNSPSSSKPFLIPHTLHLALLEHYLCLSCHNHPCHLCLIRVNVGNLFVQPDHIRDPLGAKSMSEMSFSSPKASNKVCYTKQAPYSLPLNKLGQIEWKKHKGLWNPCEGFGLETIENSRPEQR